METFQKTKPFFYLGFYYLFISLLLRIVFIFHPITTTSFGIGELFKIFGIGLLNDFCSFVLVASFLALYFLFLSNQKYQKPYGYWILAILLLLLAYTAFYPNNIFNQYGGGFPKVALLFIGLKTSLFALLLFLPSKRIPIRNILYFITIFLYTFSMTLNTVSEYFFYNEFGVRYNFIAVDYLIYTNEVIGNIMESYPIIPFLVIICSLSLGISYWIFRKTKNELLALPNFFQKLKLLAVYSVLFLASLGIVSSLLKIKSTNLFADEIQENGLPKFFTAYVNSELDYFDFYRTRDENLAEKEMLQQFNSTQLERQITSNQKEEKKNVVLISVESLSADFLEHYGNDRKITPFIDSLMNHSLVFTNLYATGNRTVRGLEALTLCIPPTPGESVVKRKNNKNKFTTGSVFKSKGYQVKYLYGGYSYFDNMKDFFEGNGYEIVDRSAFKPKEIAFANVWGVSDEDMARKAIEIMNQEAETGKPFFNHWMTVSNHRPFTYPDGRIDIPSSSKNRDGGVKYTDYALRLFFNLAKKQSWFKNTVFVLVADHCASSAGKTELPLEKYRIPALIYSEGFIEPQLVNQTMSQIDLMPTLFGLLHFKYTTKLLGQDVFSPNFQPKAYIATYQNLGLIKDQKLTVLSPGNLVNQYQLIQKNQSVSPDFATEYDEIELKQEDVKTINSTISAYQSTSFWLKNNQLNLTQK